MCKRSQVGPLGTGHPVEAQSGRASSIWRTRIGGNGSFGANPLDWINPCCKRCWIEAGEEGRKNDGDERLYKEPTWQDELDGPSERLFVDDKNENYRQCNAEHQSDCSSSHPNKAGFQNHHPP